MELRRIDKSSPIQEADLNKNQYFLSVLKSGMHKGLMSGRQASKMQAGIAEVLGELIRLYTAGESSSIKDETASTILSSIYYVIDAFTASLQSPEELFAQLREKSIKEIYQAGFEIVKTCFEESKTIYGEIKANKLIIPLVAYNEIIDRSLPDFLAAYDMEFNAHDTTYNMDYPLVFDDMALRGVFYIRQYLEKLKLETVFCNCFSPKSIIKLLIDYEAKFRLDIVNAPINLFELLFDQAVFSVLAGNKSGELTVSALQTEVLIKSLETQKSDEITSLIDEATQSIITAFKICDSELVDYLKKYQLRFTDRFLYASVHKSILNMVLVEGANPLDGKVVFQDGKRMDDDDFAHVIDLVEICEKTIDKIELINNNIHSVKDYIDLLESDCLYDDEFTAVFEVLGDMELAVLGNTVFYDELRVSPLHLTPDNSEEYKKNTEWEWQRYYIDFILHAHEDRRKTVEKLINNIVCDDMMD